MEPDITGRAGALVIRELATVPLDRHQFHGDWNYTIAQSDSR